MPAMTTRQLDNLLVIDTGGTQMIVDIDPGVPHIVHFGRRLDLDSTQDGTTEFTALLQRPRGPATLESVAPATVCPQAASGWTGRPGIRGHRPDGSASAPRFEPTALDLDGDIITVTASDKAAGLTLITHFVVMPASIRVRLELRNDGGTNYQLEELTTTVPVPARADELMRLTGRWSLEFQQHRHDWNDGMLSFDNRRGHTSHDRVSALFVGEAGFTENRGDVWGFALGWSGSATTSAEVLSDGRRVVQMGELLTSGDVAIAPGASHTTPWLECAASDRGLNGLSQAFHASIRAQPVSPRIDRPRPVVLNTWEAVYFDHNLEKLRELATRAAQVGCERFVLDDGWFHGRRNDRSGLGDWWVDADVWPDGLVPLIDHVTQLGMEFGIWIEPEMVNRDSDLYRANPDWVLADDPDNALLGRHQLVLDLGRAEVSTYLFDRLHALLADHAISFVKWDMNRDHVPVSDRASGSMHAQTPGLYALWDALRDAHPTVEFESCSSGGGRADFEILKRAERIWTSDTNDALERQRIQQGFSVLFPPEVMGAHIGPPRSHTTGRTHSLGFRASTAFFGHLGIEWNLLDASEKDLARLTDVIALHKRFRPLLHGGTVWRLDADSADTLAHMVVDADGSEALLSYSRLSQSVSSVPAPIRLMGLDPEQHYRVEVITIGHRPRGLAESQVEWLDTGLTSSGRLLETVGLPAPILNPETALVVSIVAI